MKNSKVTIRKVEDQIEIVKPAAKKRFFGRRKTFIDKSFNMRYSNFDTYEENKQDYYNTLSLVFTGKCKDIFEAYKLSHSC